MAGTLRVGYRAGHRQEVLARSYRRKTETDLGAVSTEIKRHDYTNSRELSYKMMRWGGQSSAPRLLPDSERRAPIRLRSGQAVTRPTYLVQALFRLIAWQSALI